MQRRGLIFTIGLLLSLSIVGPAYPAQVANGTKCEHLGAETKVGAIEYKCVKTAKGTIWQKVISGKASQSVNSATYKDMQGPGLLSVTCVEDSVTRIQRINAQTGKILATLTVPDSLDLSPTEQIHLNVCADIGDPDGASDTFVREQFSSDFSKITTTSQVEADGSVHVGYLDASNAKYVDITKLTMPTGFSAIVPVDVSPIFDPTTGDFCFLRSADTGEIANTVTTGPTSEIHCYNLKTNQDSVVGTIDSSTDPSLSQNFLTSQNGVLATGDFLVSPDAKTFSVADLYSEGCVDFESVQSGVAFYEDSLLDNPTDATCFNDPLEDSIASAYGWIGDDKLVIGLQSQTGIYLIPADKTDMVTVDPQDLLEPNNATNSNAVLSPDQTQMVFQHQLLNSSDLYVAAINSVGSPRKLISNFTGRLFAWN